MLEDLPITMWRPNEPAEEDVSDPPGIDPQSKRRRSRRKASRDGLADQTVIKVLENVRSYRAFERSLIGSIDPRSVLELALVHRLASLLWRLRRASQLGTLPAATEANNRSKRPASNGREHGPVSGQEQPSTSTRGQLGSWSKSRGLAHCFLHLSHVDPALLDRVGGYEARLWRQAAQAIFTLEAMRQPPPPMRQRLRNRVAPFNWDRQR
jgi:hypothetical protein